MSSTERDTRTPGRPSLDRRFDRTRLSARTGPQKRTRSSKQPPPEQTFAESFYYLKQMNARTRMVIVMDDGEEIRGWIEWYDRDSLKVNRNGAPNLLIQKRYVKYMYKDGE
ncbi:MAG: hypothetical protein WBX15_19780 [Thermoanaerobaculia bacterium]